MVANNKNTFEIEFQEDRDMRGIEVGDLVDFGGGRIKYVSILDGNRLIVVDSEDEIGSSVGQYIYPSSAKRILKREDEEYAEGGEIIEIQGFGKYKEVDGEIKVGDMAISENGMLNEYVDEDDDLYFINETHTKVIPIEEYAKGGITKGKSHKEGGIPMVVKSTGQRIELEGGEGVINKINMADTKLHDFEGKKMTKCEIASAINSDGGNGVEIDCDGITGKKYKHEDGGRINDYSSAYEIDYQGKKFTKELETEDFIYYIDENGEQVLMFRKLDNSLASDNYFAENDLYERMVEIANGREEYIYLRPESVPYLDEYKETFAKGGGVDDPYKKMIEAKGKQFAFERILKDSQFYQTNEMDKDDFIYDKNGRDIRAYPSNEKIDLYINWRSSNSSKKVTFNQPSELAEYLDNNQIFAKGGGVETYRNKYNKKYGYKKNESHSLKDISKKTGVSKKGLQQIYNKGVGAFKTNPQSVRPNVKSKEQWAMGRVYSAVMGGKASKIDAKELKMKYGGDVLSMEECASYMDEYNKTKQAKRKMKSFAQGGVLSNPANKDVQVLFKRNVDATIVDESGNYLFSKIYNKGVIENLVFLFKQNNKVYFKIPLVRGYMDVNKSDIKIEGFDYELGGGVNPFAETTLSQNDIDILDILRRSQYDDNFTILQQQFISTFIGTNVVNSMSNSLTQKVFGLVYENKSIEVSLKTFTIINNGKGNVLSLAPTDLDEILITDLETDQFDFKKYSSMERKINNIINSSKDVNWKYDSVMRDKHYQSDAILLFNPNINPIERHLKNYMHSSRLPIQIGVGVAEFSSKSKMDEFYDNFTRYDDRFSYKAIKINQGITENGTNTLIYIVKKGY